MIKIAILDDHPLLIEAEKNFINKFKTFEIVFSSLSVNEALNKLKIHQPDIIITDISMPETNGLEFINILKEKYPLIKILVYSNFYFIPKKVNGFVSKSDSPTTLIEAIKRICFKSQNFYSINDNNQNISLIFKKKILTKREKEITQLFADEKSVNEIAEVLFISKHTVITHKKNIFKKLQVKSIASLVKRAIYLGLIK